MFFSENLNDLLDAITDFGTHVKSVYELETFYGDETLHTLMRHGENLVQQFEKFDEIIYLAEETSEEDDMNEQEDGTDTEYPDETTEEKKNPTQVRFQL